MLTKTKLKEQLEYLPEEFAIDELAERFILNEKVERGYEQSERGNYVSESYLDIEIAKTVQVN